MLVELKKLHPNPMRDFAVDPIDEETVEKLRASIEEDGFWGGIVCRQTRDGTIQIGAGHHRVRAAIQAGVETADVFVKDEDEADDFDMLRIYARENATQRGNSGTAQAGSVAAAVRLIAKCALSGVSAEFGRNHDWAKIRGNVASERGVGRDLIVQFLDGVPGICNKTAEQALANIKASGDYARIIAEVRAEIERENAEAMAALARAEAEKREAEEREREAERQRKEAAAKAKAAREEAERKRAELDRQRAEAEAKLAEKRRKEAEEEMQRLAPVQKVRDTAAKAVAASAKRPVTFDFEGVARHLKNPHQIDVFRDVVTGPGISPYLPVGNQAALAERLVSLSKTRGRGELTGAFIRENVGAMVLDVKTEERRLSREDRERIEHQDRSHRLKQHQHEASGSLRSFMAACLKISKILQQWPSGTTVPISNEFRTTIEAAKKTIDTLIERI